MNAPTFVYFIRPIGKDGPVKIGCSELPVDRLSYLMSWSPVPLEVVATTPGDHKLERRIHGIFAADHSHREWFRCSPQLIEFIAKIAAGAPISELIDLSCDVAPFRKFPRRVNTAERTRYLSYSARVRGAVARAQGPPDGPMLYAPLDVDAILDRWCGYRNKSAIQPTVEENRRLDEFIKNPAAHVVTREQRWPEGSGFSIRPDIYPQDRERVA